MRVCLFRHSRVKPAKGSRALRGPTKTHEPADTERPRTASTRANGYPDTVVGDRRPVPVTPRLVVMPSGPDRPGQSAEGGDVGGLQRFEQRLENMISGAFARAFRSAVQPVEIAAALQRECDNNAQILSRERRMVPNDFHVELSQVDLDRLAPLRHRARRRAGRTRSRTTPTRRATSSRARSRSTSRPPRTSRPDGSGSGRRAQARVQSNATHTQVRRARAVLEINKTRAPAAAARPGHRPRHRGRRPHQRPRRQPAAHRVRGARPTSGRARTTSRSRCATSARPTACSSTATR